MNFSTWLKHYRKSRKIQRSIPHLWLLPSLGIGYVQNYKVGTRSIRQALSMYLYQNLPENREKDISYQEITVELTKKFNKQYSAYYRPEEMRSQCSGFELFTFVRNPLSRLYSCYANKVADLAERGGECIFAAFGIDQNTSFDEFVEIVVDIPDDKAEKHFRSQTWFISANRKLVIDFVGRFEHFNDDWNQLRKKYELPEIPHQNSSSMKENNFLKYYSPRSYQLAMERYRNDIEMLGYENDV